MIEFNTPNDTKENQVRIIQITIAVNYEEKEDKLIKRNQEISTYYHTREDNNQSAKKNM